MVVRRKTQTDDSMGKRALAAMRRAEQLRREIEELDAAEEPDRDEQGLEEDENARTETQARAAAALPAPAPMIDARDLCHRDYMQRVRDLLGDAAPHLPEVRLPPRHKTDPAVVAAAERDRIERVNETPN